MSHDNGTMDGSSIHLVRISSIPDSIEMTVLPGQMSWSSSTEIEEITYIGKDENHVQAIRMSGIPTNFDMEVSDSFSWNASSPMSSVEIQISNHSNPGTMDGDHFLYLHDGPTDTAYMSARMTNISRAAYLIADTDSDPEALDRIELHIDGSLPFDHRFNMYLLLVLQIPVAYMYVHYSILTWSNRIRCSSCRQSRRSRNYDS